MFRSENRFALLYPNPTTDYESVESALLKDSEHHILIRILRIHEPERFFVKGFEKLYLWPAVFGEVCHNTVRYMKYLIYQNPSKSRWTPGVLPRKVMKSCC